MNHLILSLGSNTGNLHSNIEKACVHIEERIGKIENLSSIYMTEPWGKTDQPYFLNRVIQVKALLTPQQVMSELLNIESEMGRKRSVKWEPRNIDLDILFYNDDIVDEKDLHIPHPHLHERNFTLVPLSEILPEYVHPVFGRTVSQLLAESPDKSWVKVLEKVRH